MNPIVKNVILILTMILTVFTVFIFNMVRSEKKAAKSNADRTAMVKGIQFKGKVISYKKFDFGGRDSYMICVKLDYSNTKSFYKLNDLCFLKIKDSIATMAVGQVDSYYGMPVYVEVNINNNGMEKYTYPGGKANEFDESLGNYNLTVRDINTCN